MSETFKIIEEFVDIVAVYLRAKLVDFTFCKFLIIQVCIYVHDCIAYNIQLLREQLTYFFLCSSSNKF